MPLHTNTTIRIEGKQELANTFNSLDIHESITGHHTFTLNLPGQAFGAGQGVGGWRELTGKRITITIAPPKKRTGGSSGNPKVFTGLITGLSLGKGYGPAGTVTLTGGAPTLLLDDDPHTEAFAEQSMQRIVKSQLRSYPKNLLRPKVNPQSSDELEYIVQYKENTWQFIRRLARTYGEWCYYDGESLIFGRRKADKIALTHDVDLDHFSLDMDLTPINMQLAGYDYHGDTVAKSEASAPSGLNGHSQAIADAGKSLFPRKGHYHPSHYLNGKASRQVQALTERRKNASVAGMVEMSGQSHQPRLGVGHDITVEEALYGSEAYGAFMLTEVHHRCSSDGDYQNTFTGIPADVATPPHRLDDHPTAGPQSAVVMDNNDPDDLGRVQVQFRWQESGRTPWLRMVAPGGGKDKGFHMIPEKGEEVMVDFEGGHPERPYVLGTTRNGSSASGFGTEKNDIKAIRTRSGHTIELDDTSGKEKINIYDDEGSIITFDTKNKSLMIQATEDLELSAKNIKMVAEENVDIQAKGDIGSASEGDTKILSKGKAALQADGDASVSSKGKVSVQAQSDAKISGKNVAAEGQAKAEVKGSQTKVQGQKTLIQGASGKIDVL